MLQTTGKSTLSLCGARALLPLETSSSPVNLISMQMSTARLEIFLIQRHSNAVINQNCIMLTGRHTVFNVWIPNQWCSIRRNVFIHATPEIAYTTPMAASKAYKIQRG